MYHSRASSSSWCFARTRIDMREHHAMEGEIPGGIPGIFPFVRHRDDVVIVEMAPVRVAAGLAGGRGRYSGRRQASAPRRSDRIAGSISFRQTPAASRPLHRRWYPGGTASRNTRRLPGSDPDEFFRSRRRDRVVPGTSRAKRSLSSTVSRAATAMRYQNAILVPWPAGFTVAAPWTT